VHGTSGPILVTGSSGHLGEALMRTLRAAGRTAIGLDCVPSAYTDHVGSITDPSVTRRCMEGTSCVFHTATLHKPHVATHSRQAFVDTNVMGTLNLLEAAVRAGVQAFIYTSTTSSFGDALTPEEGAPAVWVTEDLVPAPKNIYGVTKVAAEDLCAIVHRKERLPCVVLRTSRFFPEPDDDPAARTEYPDANLKANELLYRRVDVEDVVSAHLCALARAADIGFGRYIISATTPFHREDVLDLRRDAPAVVNRRVPEWEAVYASLGWRMVPSLGRVYDNARARADLGWTPTHDFVGVVRRVRDGGTVASALAQEIGVKGYHGEEHADGLYPILVG
jgi:nucleoside-diphosphate-sugar epimerase